MPKEETATSLVGAEILNLITTGMYHTPLAIYREYIQNAADAIEASPWPDKGQVAISIDTGKRNVRVRDNGPGLTHDQAKRDLIPIARSRKRRGVDRGFRGIGRLAGLAFADKVTFRTRTRGNAAGDRDHVGRNDASGQAAVGSTDPEEIIRGCVAVLKRGRNRVARSLLRSGGRARGTTRRRPNTEPGCGAEVHRRSRSGSHV